MLFSRKVQYGIKALITLAAMEAFPKTGSALLVDDLAKHSKVPRAFLGKIVSELCAVGILHSKRGRGGGIALTRPPSKIFLGDCVSALDRTNEQERHCILDQSPCSNTNSCPLHAEAQAIRKKIFQKTTLAQLVKDKKWIQSQMRDVK